MSLHQSSKMMCRYDASLIMLCSGIILHILLICHWFCGNFILLSILGFYYASGQKPTRPELRIQLMETKSSSCTQSPICQYMNTV